MNPDVRRRGETMQGYRARLRMQSRVRRFLGTQRAAVVRSAGDWPGFELKALARAVSDVYPLEAFSL